MKKNKARVALLTGITGQDGSYLTELLLAKSYQVHGIIRRSSTFNTSRIDHLYTDPHVNGVNLFLHYGDLADANTIRKLIYQVKPDEIYNLGAQSHVRVSFDIPEYTANVTGIGTLRMLEAVKDFEEHTGKKIKFYQASSSEMFGAAPPPQNENTPFYPRSPYGIAKVLAFHTTRRNICNAENRPWRCANRGGARQKNVFGKLGSETGLGIRAGICRGNVENASTKRPRRLCSRHGRIAYGERIR